MRYAALALLGALALSASGLCAGEGAFAEPGEFQLVPVPGVEGLFKAEEGPEAAGEEEGMAEVADGDARVLASADEEGGRGVLRGLAARKRKPKKTPAPSTPAPSAASPNEDLDIPSGGCGTAKNGGSCQAYASCTWVLGRCKQTADKLKNFLFIGNSFTFVNDLPKTFAGLANAGGHNSAAYFMGIGAASFQSHWANPLLSTYVKLFKWHAITLQEQSMFLSQRPSQYIPSSVEYAKKLYRSFGNNTDNVVLYQTWGYQNGNPSFLTGLDDDYSKMQSRLVAGYNYTLAALRGIRNVALGDAPVIMSPVGQAWAIAQDLARFKGKMWQQDGMHPLPCGTYLAASVFYAKLFGESPVGNKFLIKGVSAADARVLQQIAADYVLGNR
jgi:hypothetical protein